MKQDHRHAGMASSARGRFRPTPISVSKRTRTVLFVLGLVALALLIWAAPTVPVVLLGDFALAMPLSFPVRWLSRVVPRGFAILVSFLALIGLGVLVLLVLVPISIEQLSSLIRAAPDVLRGARETLLGMLEPLLDLGLLLIGCSLGSS